MKSFRQSAVIFLSARAALLKILSTERRPKRSNNIPMRIAQWYFVMLAVISSSAVALGAASLSDEGQSWGHFVGTVKTEWHDDGRTMTLLGDFGYVDGAGYNWKAEKGHKIDGASIPTVFWSVIGGPFEGKYRNASVVHDFECDEQKRPWRTVHRMFYGASRCGGVERVKAKVMFAAVYHFGRRWGADKGRRPFRTDADFRRVRRYVEGKPAISLEEIEGLDQARLAAFERKKRR
jgi:hypothetical protein